MSDQFPVTAPDGAGGEQRCEHGSTFTHCVTDRDGRWRNCKPKVVSGV